MVLLVLFGIEMHDGLVFWLLFVFIGCLHGCLCCFAGFGLLGGLGRCVVWSWNDVIVVPSDSVSDAVVDAVGDIVGSLYAESVSSVLLCRSCNILVDCFVDVLLSLGVNAGLAKWCLVATMNFAIFI